MTNKNNNSLTGAHLYQNLSLSKLREQEQLLVQTHDWWQKQITDAANELEKESNKLSPDFQKVELLQNKIEHLQNKGRIEENECNKFQKIKDEYLLFRLQSGINNVKW